jgi:ribosome-associated translation inhibitor RaiA
MSDGYFIRFREMIPEEGLLKLAMAEISMLHDTWPERVQCNIVIASRHPCAHERRYDAEVQVELGRGDNIESKAASADPYAALRQAFRALRQRMPMLS